MRYRGIINNDFNGIAWADRVTVTTRIAFSGVDHKLLIFLINCLERAFFQAFPAGNTFFGDAHASIRDVFTAIAKAGS
jgi:hypothetical protein